MSLENSDILELKDRYNFIIQKYAKLSLDLAPKLKEFGKYRRELQLLVAEFSRREESVGESEELVELINQELDKIDDGKETDKIC